MMRTFASHCEQASMKASLQIQKETVWMVRLTKFYNQYWRVIYSKTFYLMMNINSTKEYLSTNLFQRIFLMQLELKVGKKYYLEMPCTLEVNLA